MKTINLGDRVKDKVTGFAGIVTAKTEWLNGCVRLTVQPEKLEKDGKVKDGMSFDIEQLELVKSSAVRVQPQYTGGPRPEPARRAEPRR